MSHLSNPTKLHIFNGRLKLGVEVAIRGRVLVMVVVMGVMMVVMMMIILTILMRVTMEMRVDRSGEGSFWRR